MIERLRNDDAFAAVTFGAQINPLDFVGRAPQQVDEFIEQEVKPIRQRYADTESLSVEVTV